MSKKVADPVDQTDVKSNKATKEKANLMSLWDVMFKPKKSSKGSLEEKKAK